MVLDDVTHIRIPHCRGWLWFWCDADGFNQCVDAMRSTGGPTKLMRRNLSILSLSDGSVQPLMFSHAWCSHMLILIKVHYLFCRTPPLYLSEFQGVRVWCQLFQLPCLIHEISRVYCWGYNMPNIWCQKWDLWFKDEGMKLRGDCMIHKERLNTVFIKRTIECTMYSSEMQVVRGLRCWACVCGDRVVVSEINNWVIRCKPGLLRVCKCQDG